MLLELLDSLISVSLQVIHLYRVLFHSLRTLKRILLLIAILVDQYQEPLLRLVDSFDHGITYLLYYSPTVQVLFVIPVCIIS